MIKTYLVTGATSGIGLATCESILNNGNRVFAIGRDEKKVQYLESKYSNDQFVFIQFDLRELTNIESIFEKISNLSLKLDGFIHCAGMEETVPLTQYTSDKITNLFQLNVFSTIELLRLFSKKKYSNENSSVVLFSSVMGILGQPGKVGYCATKSAVLGITKSSALELAKRKIRVNAVLPGVVKTPMTQKLFSQLDQTNIDAIINMHPLGIGEVNDVVPIVEFLLTDGSRWITGQNFVVDGGYTIQ
jgi:NAD(P)-dependent dehydrogenase (short-subunit alcohol dehydrogenase family)